ncbi:MAG: hypothetical protein BroJett021_22480 [Chloroflexota bacterium]|nr:MAG: hypothetical protein BroJett021_22480 [Chloroflexota bacterium]
MRTNVEHLWVRRSLCVLMLLLVGLLLLATPARAATFTVTTTANSGAGSLRQAILDANANPGADTITFAIGATGSQQTLQPTGVLPIISEAVTIDGWSQGGAGYTGPPLIELNGSLAGSSVVGLNITGGGSTVRGLVINGFAIGSFAGGIRLQTGGGNWVYGNYIGTNFAGDTRIANQRGIWIDGGSSNNRIGTNADGVNDVAERNVISANVEQNIWIYQPTTTGNKIMGNYIGLNAAGTASVGVNNQTVATNGILIQEAAYTVIGTDGDGQGDALEGNVISGNTYNIQLTGATVNRSHHNRISGNLIGTNASGTAGVGIQVEGVRVYVAYDNLIGTDGDGVSDALEGNLISGNIDFGVMLQQTGALNNVVAGNKIGTDITGMNSIPNGYGGAPRAGIILGGYGNRIGTNSDGLSDELERNLISGNSQTSISAIYFNNLPNPDAPPTIIAGNWMGVNATGLAALPNNYGIGGTSSVPVIIRDNVIAGHTYEGIITHSSNMLITGNRIGVGADGVTPLGNGQNGLFLSGNNNLIGGTGSGEANIIAHNGTVSAFYSGVRVGNTGLSNSIRGNRIYANSQLGIDLRWPDGVNINDPDDPDTGGNNLQNYPVVTFAQSYANGTTRIHGTLNSNPNVSFTLDFYYSAAADPSGYGEGEYYLGATSVATDVSGDAAFDVTLPAAIPPNQFVSATATHADGSTSEFSLAYAAGGVADVPIAGLSIQVTPPIYADLPAQFVASISAGTGIDYAWEFGDGGLGSGALVEHTFATPGTYTVTVAAENNSSSAITSTLVSVLEPANINGVIWLDRDADGFFGLGETSYNVVQNTIVTTTLQEPPHTVLTAGRDIHGNYQIFTPQAGVYLVEATNLYVCSIIANCISTPNPVPVAMGADGGTEVNFGIMSVPFVPQPEDDGYIVGRAWLDSNANGYPDPNEFPLNSYTVRLLDANGNQLATHVTGSSWSHGAYAFRISEPGLYRVQMNVASGIYPASREVEVYVAGMNMVSVQLPFAAGGTIGGQISDSSGAAVSGAALNLLPGNLQPLFFPGGGYGFFGLDNGNYTLQLAPPATYVTADGVTQRFVPATLNGSAVENWTLLKKGELTIKAVQVVNGQALPITFLPFELLLDGSQVRVAFTNAQGEALVEGLAPGTYTVRPWGEIANLVPGLQLTPAERTAVVSNDSAATLNFSGTLSRSLNMFCQLAGTFGQGFACIYEVRTLSGSLIETGYLPASQPATSNWNLNPATLEVRLIPAPDIPGQEGWPTYSQIVTLDNNTHANVYYPYNPTNPQTIAGYAFWDRCAPLGVRANGNNCTESNVPSNNGIPVVLYNASGGEVASTVTANGPSWNTGYFSFPNLPVGVYRARVNLPSGYAPTTGVERWFNLTGVGAVELLEVGYQLNTNQVLGGRVFRDNDGNGLYDPAWDDPVAGASVAVTTPSGQSVANRTTASDGSYQVSPINSGEYRVTLNHDGKSWTRDASIPVDGGVPLIDFALPPDNQPRVLVFIDGNHNGVVDAGEQRLASVAVRLRDVPCGSSGAELQMVNSNDGGLATFNPVASGLTPVCAQAMDGLPDGLLPASPNGVNVPRSGGAPMPLAVQAVNTLLVRAFLDSNSNSTRDSDEPFISGGSITINSIQQTISSAGATFYLPTGVYALSFTPPTGYSSLWEIAGVSVAQAAQTLSLPLRDAGRISGKVFPPNTGGFSLGGSSLASGLTVQLQNIATAATVATTGDSYGNFSFVNLAPATYRLRLPAPPPGYTVNSEPLITYQTGQILSNNNLSLVPVGHIVGAVYNDMNSNQQWDNNEPGVSDYAVRLVGAGGQQVAVATPDTAGYFRFEGLSANTPYALQLVSAPSSLFITTSPGVFTVGAEHTVVQLGVGVETPPTAGNQYVGGVVRYQQGEALIPIAGARIIYYASVNGSCNVANPTIQYDQYTGLDGGYGSSGTGGCFRVVDVPGFNHSAAYGWGGCGPYSAGCYLINGGYGRIIDITLTPTPPPLRASANGTAQVVWSAFRDDNGNGARDPGEPGLAGATLADGSSSGVSGQTGWGQPLALVGGLHTLTITPPDGYVVNGPTIRHLSVQGADVTLPAIPLRPAGLTTVQAFVDLDADGVQDAGETGVGGVNVSLTGAAAANATTTANGRAQFANLPDGAYTLTAVAPIGYAAIASRTINLAQGGAIQLALQLPGLVSAVVYEDWDGDGRQQPDEPLFRTSFTLTLDAVQAKTMGGRSLFLGTAVGSYALAATTPTVQPQSITLVANAGQGAALAVAAPNTIRGSVWLDSNGDGMRQSWEAPLAGVPVTMAGQTAVTDNNGRFIFIGVATAAYQLSIALPDGLSAAITPITLSTERGGVVGIAVVERREWSLYLPLVNR